MSESAPFLGLARTLEEVRSTGSKKAKVDSVARFLRNLSPADAEIAARLVAGRSSERGSKDESQVGYSTLLEVIQDVTGATQSDISRVFLRHGDLGDVAEELLAKKKEQTLFSEELTLKDLGEAFQKLRTAKGKGSSGLRKGVVKSLILRASPLEGKYVVKVLTGEMRTGMVSGLLEESIASAFSLQREQAARAHMTVGDIGVLARAAAEGGVDKLSIQVFRPVNFMLAEPMADEEETAGHFGKAAYAEFKYDGIRAQVHKKGGEVRVYSRRLEDVTASFPEVVGSAKEVKGECILDGEIVPYKEGRPLPFQLLQRRLRRMEDFEEAARNAPVRYFAFDLLMDQGKETVGLPLKERRRRLAAMIRGTGILQAESKTVRTQREVGSAFRRSRELGYEGLVVKDPESQYVMGKRGSGWVKLKEELDTLDVVIVAAEFGHGKRARVISDYTFAVKDGDGLKTIGKAYSGLTDEEIDTMTERLKAITIKDRGFSRDVRPEIVLEVAFDSIQRSARHDSGYALRFPRIKRIRSDKGPADISSLEDVERVFSRQKVRL